MSNSATSKSLESKRISRACFLFVPSAQHFTSSTFAVLVQPFHDLVFFSIHAAGQVSRISLAFWVMCINPINWTSITDSVLQPGHIKIHITTTKTSHNSKKTALYPLVCVQEPIPIGDIVCFSQSHRNEHVLYHLQSVSLVLCSNEIFTVAPIQYEYEMTQLR